MAESTLTPEQIQTLIDGFGPGNQADNLKVNGYVYAIKDGKAVQVRDEQGNPLREAVKSDTSPTTIHVPGKGTLEYHPEATDPEQRWQMVPGSEEKADAPKLPTYNLADGRVGVIKFDANNNPFGQALGGDNPANPAPAPTKTAQQIADESGANVAQSNAATAHSNALTANIESPADAHTRRLSEIRAQGQANADAIVSAAKAKVDAGIEMKEEDKLKLQNDLAGILAETQSNLKQAQEQATFDREQPNKDREFGIQQQTADSNAAQVENTRINNERTQQLQRDKGQADVLTSQATQGQAMLDRVVKAGVAPSMSSLKAALDPLQLAFQIMQGQVKDGSLQQHNLPTPAAPRPVGATSGPSVPAPATTTPDPQEDY